MVNERSSKPYAQELPKLMPRGIFPIDLNVCYADGVETRLDGNKNCFNSKYKEA